MQNCMRSYDDSPMPRVAASAANEVEVDEPSPCCSLRLWTAGDRPIEPTVGATDAARRRMARWPGQVGSLDRDITSYFVCG